MERPSIAELHKKIKQAENEISSDAIELINPVSLASDASDLGYAIRNLKSTLLVILSEIEPKHYAGNRPPEKSYTREILNSELFAFRWKSTYLGCEVYFKFSLTKNKFYLVSLHEHRDKKGGNCK